MGQETTIDDIIHAYLLAIENRPRWSHKYILLRFMRRWPEHAQELMEFVALNALIERTKGEREL